MVVVLGQGGATKVCNQGRARLSVRPRAAALVASAWSEAGQSEGRRHAQDRMSGHNVHAVRRHEPPHHGAPRPEPRGAGRQSRSLWRKMSAALSLPLPCNKTALALNSLYAMASFQRAAPGQLQTRLREMLTKRIGRSWKILNLWNHNSMEEL